MTTYDYEVCYLSNYGAVQPEAIQNKLNEGGWQISGMVCNQNNEMFVYFVRQKPWKTIEGSK